MRRPLIFALTLCLAPGLAAGGDYARLRGGNFRSALNYENADGRVRLPPFLLMKRPVTNAEFLTFVMAHPQWRRDRVARVFAEPRYLQHWYGPMQFGASAKPTQPVVNVSWFAADAYCQAQDAHLPTWNEWEYVAAADRTRRDARADPAWRESILDWYAKPSNAPLDSVGKSPANVYGIHDLHGLVWEWVEDYASMLVSGDSREQKEPDRLKFCGAGALAFSDRDNYAVLMRVAMLSALEAANTTSSLGFRCAKTLPRGHR